MHRAVRFALLLPAFFIAGCSRAPAPSTAPDSNTPGGTPGSVASAAPAADPAPAWTLNDLDGKPVSLADFRGKVVVLDIWATWCPPCRAEIPHFIEIQNEYKDKGVTVVGMSVDSTGPADVAKFAKDNGMNYPIVMADDKTATAYGADQGIPFTLVIDKNGNVVARHLGLTDKSVFEDDIKKALAE
jgi:thiol-disulfide isomerase/thioredoxin